MRDCDRKRGSQRPNIRFLIWVAYSHLPHRCTSSRNVALFVEVSETPNLLLVDYLRLLFTLTILTGFMYAYPVRIVERRLRRSWSIAGRYRTWVDNLRNRRMEGEISIAL
jgi:hypothetical protein